MKITVEKICRSVIDTAKERKRINNAFRDDKKTRDVLNQFMDAVEDLNWEKAGDILYGDWLQSYDAKRGCSRSEFIGLLHATSQNGINAPSVFEHRDSYIDLVYVMLTSSKYLRVVKTA